MNVDSITKYFCEALDVENKEAGLHETVEAAIDEYGYHPDEVIDALVEAILNTDEDEDEDEEDEGVDDMGRQISRHTYDYDPKKKY